MSRRIGILFALLFVVPTIAQAWTISTSIPSGKGSLVPNRKLVIVDENLSSETVTILPATGYVIDKVVVDGVDETASVADGTIQIVRGMEGSHTLAVYFALAAFEVNAEEQPDFGQLYLQKIYPARGTLSTEGLTALREGDIVRITVSPDQDGRVSSLSVDGGATNLVTVQPAVGVPFVYDLTVGTADVSVEAVIGRVPTAATLKVSASASATRIPLGREIWLRGVIESKMPVNYLWDVAPAGAAVADPSGYSTSRATGLATTFSASAEGTYTVRLVANGRESNPVAIKVVSAAADLNNPCLNCHATRNPEIIAAYDAGDHGAPGTACTGCHTGSHGSDEFTADVDLDGGVPAVADYAGSEVCGSCHAEQYETFVKSGHAFGLSRVVDDAVPAYPFSDISGALDRILEEGAAENSLGIPATYGDASYVVGGFGWKARWMDADGYLVTGGGVQYNLADGTLSDYGPGEPDRGFDCGNCHTTGWKHYDAADHPYRQDGLPGMDGTFAAAGIGCESCHGAGSRHAATGDPALIARTASPRGAADLLGPDMAYGKPVACGECHTRDGERDYPSYQSPAGGAGYGGDQGGRIASDGTVAADRQQYDELLALDINADGSPGPYGPLGRHIPAKVSCAACHDPHKTTRYQDVSGDGPGADAACSSCHSVTFNLGGTHASTPCGSCHMPRLAQSAIRTGERGADGTYTGLNKAGAKVGDVRSHIFKIDLSQAAQITPDAKWVYPRIVPDYACGSCHSDPQAQVAALPGGTVHGTAALAHGTDSGSCLSCHDGEPGGSVAATDVRLPDGDTPPSGDDPETLATPYVGSGACRPCHADKFSSFVRSGHNFALTRVADGSVPAYPYSDISGALEQVLAEGEGTNSLGIPASYAEASYVVGGYGWKARWTDLDGFLVTGTAVQYDLADGAPSDYHPGQSDEKFDCGNCHTTGWQPADGTIGQFGTQYGLPGMGGTFVATGIQCEACHGAGAAHVASGNPADIVRVAEPRSGAQLLASDQAFGLPVACSECHTRDGERNSRKATPYVSDFNADFPESEIGEGGRIAADGTVALSHEQYDELLGILPADYDVDGDGTDEPAGTALGGHLPAGVGCAACHDPHKTTRYQDAPANGAGPGVDRDCLECHGEKIDFTVGSHSGIECIACHMPKLARSAARSGTNAAGAMLGDLRSHLFRINLGSTDQVTDDGRWLYPWITPDYACGSCHADTAARVGKLPGGTVHP